MGVGLLQGLRVLFFPIIMGFPPMLGTHGIPLVQLASGVHQTRQGIGSQPLHDSCQLTAGAFRCLTRQYGRWCTH
jgi:hypothetical protein